MVTNNKTYICPICNQEIGSRGYPNHVKSKHNLELEEFYLIYIAKDKNECYCKTCGKKLKFKGITIGYNNFCSNSCIRLNGEIIEKTKKTNLEKYGTEWQISSKQTREKTKNTCLEHYGVENSLAAPEVREKIKTTCQKRYGGNGPSNSKEVVKRQRHTYNKHKENSKFLKNMRSKTEKTLLDRYGDPHYNNFNKYKQTCLDKYGVDNYRKSEEFKEQYRQLMLEKYGVEYYAQADEFHKNKLSRYFYNGEIFDSSYEICFYKYCLDNNINIRKNTQSIKYEFNGKIHKYFPDFVIDNNFVEIKGSHFFENNKMINY